ncbi:MAG: GNAT family N-acetyltransferase [Oscillospiraceae bacterium]|nr:GNAT family N-acetyltransferase [Oscillospiraceae bacterium]
MIITDREITKAELDAIYADFKVIEERDGVPHFEQKRHNVVAEENGVVVGFASGLTDHKWFFLSDLWVSEEYRRQGLGTKLLSMLEDSIKTVGIEHIYTWTSGFINPKFYEKQGYYSFTVFEDFFEVKGYHHIGYRKDFKTNGKTVTESESRSANVKGLELCEGFFFEIAKPLLDMYFNDLSYSAGLIGWGSDVLGYDDEISTDHMWGPRFYLFLDDNDVSKKQEIIDVLCRHLPYKYKGHSVNFSAPDQNDNGVRHQELITEGKVSPFVSIYTLHEYLSEYLGTSDLENLTGLDWLSFSEHRLLGLTSGKIFVDGLNIKNTLDKLRFYPKDVCLYLIASNWSLIAEEQAFVRRCFDVGDNVGSIMVCARIADRLMRLAFLYCGKYAPYSKWFGTAFSQLSICDDFKHALSSAVTAADIYEREHHIVNAQKMLADMHNQSGLTDPVNVSIELYFDRKIKVIFADKIANAVMKRLSGTVFENYPLIGTLSGVPNYTSIFDNPSRRTNIKALYNDV